MSDAEETGKAPAHLDEIERRVSEIQQRKRGRIRWTVGKHTAELAIEAIGPDRKIASARNGKQRRRKKNKRML